MEIHHVKTDPEPFLSSWAGCKPYEIRTNDRNYTPGDVLVLWETRHSAGDMSEGAPLEYTGRWIAGTITEVREGYGLREGWCTIGLRAPTAWELPEVLECITHPIGLEYAAAGRAGSHSAVLLLRDD